LGQPTPLSSELDLTVVVKNVDDFKPVFIQHEFITQLTGTDIFWYISEECRVLNSFCML
jgi:hypothetical protein